MKHLIVISLLLFIGSAAFSQQSQCTSQKIAAKMKPGTLLSAQRAIANNGIVYYVGDDKKTVYACENGQTRWQVNVISVCGRPSVGKPEIRSLQIKGDFLHVIFGKHSFAKVALADGKTTFLGSD